MTGDGACWRREFRCVINSIGKKKRLRGRPSTTTLTLTLMPPPQPYLTSRICGFVCRSCISQLRRPQPPRAQWLMRSVTNGPPRARVPKSKKQTEEPSVRYFDQAPDGERREVVDDPKESAMLKDVEEQIRLLEDGEGQFVFDGEPSDALNQALKEFGIPESMTSAMEEMNDQMENNLDLKDLSDEERASIRNRLLGSNTKGILTLSS